MNTNTVETISAVTQTLGAVAQQIQAQPLSVLLIGCLLILGGLIKLVFNVSKNFGKEMEKNGFIQFGRVTRIVSVCCIQLIPVFTLAAGVKTNLLIANPGDVAPCPKPEVVIAMWGACLWVVAWVIHYYFGGIIEKRVPILAGKPENGHTEEFLNDSKPTNESTKE